jgi:hypothetical protein
MPDDIDRQVERDQAELDALITYRKPIKPATGRCFNCDEPVPTGVHYCDKDCQQDHEQRQRFNR